VAAHAGDHTEPDLQLGVVEGENWEVVCSGGGQNGVCDRMCLVLFGGCGIGQQF
jgi:hypothetical protein